MSAYATHKPPRYPANTVNGQHWRARQLCGQRDVLRLAALVAFSLLIMIPNNAIQLMAGVAVVIALYSQYRAGVAAREIDQAAMRLCFETDPERESEARERLDSLVIGSRWHHRL